MELLVLALLSTLVSALPCIFGAHIEPILSQSQESGDQGQYQYSYKSGLESKSEFRTPDGRTQGSYSYIDSDGKVQLVKYTAGTDGFHAETSHLPIEGARHVPEVHAPHHGHFGPVHQPASGVLGDTPEVAAARRQHAAAHAAALAVLPKIPQHHETNHHAAPILSHFDQSGILGDTPEVAAARMQHAAAHAAALRGAPQQSFGHHGPAHFPSNPVSHNHFLGHNSGDGKLAEDIPRSALGETPEVAAARETHLAFFAKVRAGLPEDSSNRQFHR